MHRALRANENFTSCFDWQQSIDLQSIGDELSEGQGTICRVHQTNRRTAGSALRTAKLAPQPEKIGSKVSKSNLKCSEIRIDLCPEKRGHCNRRQLLLLFIVFITCQCYMPWTFCAIVMCHGHSIPLLCAMHILSHCYVTWTFCANIMCYGHFVPLLRAMDIQCHFNWCSG